MTPKCDIPWKKLRRVVLIVVLALILSLGDYRQYCQTCAKVRTGISINPLTLFSPGIRIYERRHGETSLHQLICSLSRETCGEEHQWITAFQLPLILEFLLWASNTRDLGAPTHRERFLQDNEEIEALLRGIGNSDKELAVKIARDLLNPKTKTTTSQQISRAETARWDMQMDPATISEWREAYGLPPVPAGSRNSSELDDADARPNQRIQRSDSNVRQE